MLHQTHPNATLTKGALLPLMTCRLCLGLYRDAHTINECMCTFCKPCILGHFENGGSKCPGCQQGLGGKPTESLVRDLTMQSLVDWLFPEFKQRHEARQQSSQPAAVVKPATKRQPDEPDFEFKLVPFPNEDQHLCMAKMPKTLKYANSKKTIAQVKKHIHSYLNEPVDNIEILCKNIVVADSHTLEYVKRTRWVGHNTDGEVL